MARRSSKSTTPSLDPFDLEASLTADTLRPCYVVVGEEAFLRETALGAVRKAALGPNPGPAYRELEGSSASLHEVLDELRTLTFFGGYRLAVVRDATTFIAEHVEALLTFLASPPANATLVITAPKVDKRKKVAKQLLATAALVTCDPLDEAGLLRFLRQRAKHWGRSFERGADRALMDQLGRKDVSLGTLDTEARKLASAGKGPITREEVESLGSHGSSEDSFGLIDRVASGDVKGALETLHVIYRDGLVARGDRTTDSTGISLMIMGLLRWDLGRLLRARALFDQGAKQFQITKELKIWKDKPGFMRRLKRADRAELGRRHELLRRADAAMKTSADARTTLTSLVVQLGRG
ncbi:DNA polymerase III subunit delta [Planctomycetota bacterium]|nr:DNA polymerase III subunit delta [Planctomycetota bacterium]